MPYLDLAVAAALLAALLIGFLRRRRRPLAVSVAGAVTLVLLGVALVHEGARWQVLLLAVGAVLVAGAVLWARSGRSRGWARAVAVLLSAGLIATGATAWAPPPVFVPPPTDTHAVGATAVVWTDASRDAHGGVGGEGHRSIPATIWYPATSPGTATAYLPSRPDAEGLAGALSAQYGLPAFVLDGLVRAQGTASWDAPAAQGSVPVVLASPGTASTRWLMRSWAEELASRGTVVVALDHPYDSAVAELDDGSTVRSEPTSTGDDAHDQALADAAARVRAADIRATIDEIEGPARTLPALRGADPRRIVAAGHSLGGAAAVDAARLDDRIRAVVDIDGMPRSLEGTRLARPAVFVVSGDAGPNPAYAAAVSGYLADETAARVTIAGVAHLGLVDSGLLLGPIPGITGARGPEGPRLAARATEAVLDALHTGRGLDRDALAAIGTVG